MKVSSAEFKQDMGRYQMAAQREPVRITDDGHPDSVLVSAALFELMVKGRVARRVEDLDEDTIVAITRSEVPAEFGHLDALLDERVP